MSDDKDDKNPFTGLDFNIEQLSVADIPEDVQEIIELGARIFQSQLALDESLQMAIRGEFDENRAVLAENSFCLGFLTFYTNMKEYQEKGGDDVVH